MLTHSELNARFVELDTHPVLMSTSLDGWLAWPIVKERLWLLCWASNETSGTRRLMPSRGAARLTSGVAQIRAHLANPFRSELALVYEQRSVGLPDGRQIHPHLGDLAEIECDQPALHYLYAWGKRDAPQWRHGLLEDSRVGAVFAAAAKAVRLMPDISRVANSIVSAVSSVVPEVPQSSIALAARDQLARFRLRFRFFSRLFRTAGVRDVTVLDWDGKVAEVAAAKATGARVTELQHGMFSTNEPDYSWTATHRKIDLRLPIPDRVVVFGPLWSRQLVASGYWRENEIVEAVNPVLAPYRMLRDSNYRRCPGTPLVVLFASQPYVRDAAIELFGRALERQAKSDAGKLFSLRIKVHPLDQEHKSQYAALADRFSDSCVVVEDDRDAFSEMLEADVVAGYTSLMLLEAVALGIPLIALRGGGAPQGFCDTFGVHEIADVVFDCDDSVALETSLSQLLDVDKFNRVSTEFAARARRIYCFDAGRVEHVLRAH